MSFFGGNSGGQHVTSYFHASGTPCLDGLHALAQMNFIGPGSTAQGDYLRGVGVASFGMGVYNHQTAIANSINAETAMRINEYVYACLVNENRVNAEHREAMAAQDKENYNKIRQRIDRTGGTRCQEGGRTQRGSGTIEQFQDPGEYFPFGRGTTLGG